MKKIKLLWELFFTFFKIGLFTFGGGYAMVSIIESICVERKKWLKHDEMMNLTVIAESTPGPIAINCATYVGYKQAGLIGSVCGTLGMVLPSFVIIYIISKFLENFLEITVVANAMKGINIAVSLLIVNAGRKMFKKCKKTPTAIIFTVIAFLLVLAINIFSINFSTVILLLASGVIGLAVKLVSDIRKGDKQ